MDRRYYGLKAFLLGVAFVAAIAGGGFECSRLHLTRDAHYQASVLAQAALDGAGNKISRALGQIFTRAWATL